MALLGRLRLFLPTLLLSTLLIGTRASSHCQSEPVQTSSFFNFNIFEEVLSNFSSIARTLDQAPFVSGIFDTSSPAYEFEGNGFIILDDKLSDTIRSSSCASREITIYSSVFLRDSQSDGPLLDISYADGLGASCPAFGMYLDAKADRITLAYRHQGLLHTESFSTRLHGGRWRKYALSLSGNLLSLYVNCEFVNSKIVPLPDFCVNDSDVIVSVADSANRDKLVSEYENGLYVYLQNIGFQFGDGGILQQCPDIPQVCPTCGQYLSLVEKVYKLQNEVEILQTKVSRLERDVPGTPSKDPGTTTPPPNTGFNCFVNGQTVMGGTFFNNEGKVCYCDNGNGICKDPDEICPSVPTNPPTGSSLPSDTSPSQPSVGCTFTELPNRILAQGESVFQYQNDMDQCIIFGCEFDQSLQDFLSRSDRFDCQTDNTSVYMTCSPQFDDFQQSFSKCCLFCNACDFANCPTNSFCNRDSTCQCDDGFEKDDQDMCIDIDECLLGPQQNGHNCPQLSNCTNLPGGFDCICEDGYSMEIKNNGDRRCEDNNECQLGTANCTVNSVCQNTQGSFMCPCNQGYDHDSDGNCIAVCDPPCQNGGRCLTPDTCTCLTGYTGEACEVDINECVDGPHNCLHPKSECINTNGGFFCRCQPGFQGNGSFCRDVDECALRIHNCISRSGVSCENTIGGFTCLCNGIDCTGSCKRGRDIINNKQSLMVGCRNCTCIDGELTCRKTECNCSDPNFDPTCCSQCNRRDCVVNGTITIRPGATWINPERSCQRCSCRGVSGKLVADCVDLSQECPPLNCPDPDLLVFPMGKCCPVCLLPECDARNEGRVATFRNGCRTCTCQGGVWSCTDRVRCGEQACNPTDIMFYKDDCCPVCAHEVLGTQLPVCT